MRLHPLLCCASNGATNQCIGAGGTSAGPPLLVQTIDGGVTWNPVTTIPPLSTAGFFSGASCTSSVTTAICFAVGENLGSNSGLATPLLALSQNGGLLWTIPYIPALPVYGILSGAGS